MATWIAHLRIADQLIKALDIEDERAFLVGSIAPDSGIPNEDWSRFDPPSSVSHWMLGPYKNHIDTEGFYRKYLCAGWQAFYLGYYTHLHADVLWSNRIMTPTYYRHQQAFDQDPKFIWTVKKDWYGHDHAYLQENPEWTAMKTFCASTDFANTYLDYYPAEAFSRQVAYICDYYRQYVDAPDREDQYLTREAYENYIEEAVRFLYLDLTTKKPK